MNENVTLKDFIAKLHETKGYSSTALKEYRVMRVTEEEVDLRDDRTKMIYTVPIISLYNAITSLTPKACTVPNMKKFVGTKAAPACAALISWTVGRRQFWGSFDRLFQQFNSLVESESQREQQPSLFKKEVANMRKDSVVWKCALLRFSFKKDFIDSSSTVEVQEFYYQYVISHPEKCLRSLTVNELSIIKLAIKNQGKFRTNEHCYGFIMPEVMGWMKVSNDSGTDKSLNLYELSEELVEAFSPYIDDIYKEKSAHYEDVLEEIFLGLVNIRGRISDERMPQLMHQFIASKHSDLPIELIHFWLLNTILPNFCYKDNEDGFGPAYYSILFNFEEWTRDIRQELPEYMPKTLEEVRSRGHYPHMIPYEKTEKDFFKLFEEKIGKEGAHRIYDFVYSKVQDPNADLSELSNFLLSPFYTPQEKAYRDAANILNDMTNNIPRFFLKGNTPTQAFQKKCTEAVPSKKVGRNDPCPCGSGKKYKHCCGK